MSHFCLLRDPEAYVATDWDLIEDAASQAYWLDLFATHFVETMAHASHRYGRSAGKHIAAAREQFAEALEAVRREPASLPGGKLNVLVLCRLREKALRENGLGDPFGHIKGRENGSAGERYLQTVRHVHTLGDHARWPHLIQGIFTGNLLDLGSAATMNLSSDSADFLAAAENIQPRRWLVDDFDRLLEDLTQHPPPWSKAVVFLDNSGSDFILGLLPMVRELALAGTQIVLAGNELPTLNDLTADEAGAVVDDLAAVDADLDALLVGEMIQVVSSGSDTPLLDLSEVSDELNEAAGDADLVLLEGMGRAVESNFDTPFRVDCLRLALLKDPEVAAHVGGKLYDCVCKYVPAEDEDED